MSRFRFNHVFFGLMTLSLLTAFVLPTRGSDRVRASTANIFLPVSMPVRSIAARVSALISKPPPRDDGSPLSPRPSDVIYTENQILRTELSNLKGQLLYLQQRINERQQFGEIGPFCTMFSVAAGDSAGRDSLMLAGSTFNDIKAGQAVLYNGGFAGKILRAGIGEARVQLVTDNDFRIQASFARSVIVDGKPDLRPLNSPPTVLTGTGKDVLIGKISGQFIEQSTLQEGDYAVVNDGEWPRIVSGYQVGVIMAIERRKEAGWFTITVKPGQVLKVLKEVLVLNKLEG